MHEPLPSIPRPLLLAIVIEGGIGLLAVALGSLLRHPPTEAISWNLQSTSVGGAAAIPLVAAVWFCIRSGWKPFRQMLHLLDESIIPLFKTCRAWELATIAAVAGVGEEMLFRGVIQNAIADQFAPPLGPAIGLVAAALVFGLLHWVTPTYALLATLIGLYLGWLWLATGNLLVPAVAHAVYDFWALTYLVRYRSTRSGSMT